MNTRFWLRRVIASQRTDKARVGLRKDHRKLLALKPSSSLIAHPMRKWSIRLLSRRRREHLFENCAQRLGFNPRLVLKLLTPSFEFISIRDTASTRVYAISPAMRIRPGRTESRVCDEGTSVSERQSESKARDRFFGRPGVRPYCCRASIAMWHR